MEFGNWALFKLLLFGKPWGMRGEYFFRRLFLSFWLMIFKLIKFFHFLLFFYFISAFFDKLCAMRFIISSLFLRLISISLLFVVSAPEVILYFGFNFLLSGLTHLSIPIPKIISWFLLFILILLLLFFLLLIRF